MKNYEFRSLVTGAAVIYGKFHDLKKGDTLKIPSYKVEFLVLDPLFWKMFECTEPTQKSALVKPHMKLQGTTTGRFTRKSVVTEVGSGYTPTWGGEIKRKPVPNLPKWAKIPDTKKRVMDIQLSLPMFPRVVNRLRSLWYNKVADAEDKGGQLLVIVIAGAVMVNGILAVLLWNLLENIAG